MQPQKRRTSAHRGPSRCIQWHGSIFCRSLPCRTPCGTDRQKGRNMKKPVFTGSATALVTPFTDRGVDYDRLAAALDRQAEGGTAAVVVCGTTGEAATLSEAERASIIEFTAVYTRSRMKVIAGIGGNDTRRTARGGRTSAYNALLQQSKLRRNRPALCLRRGAFRTAAHRLQRPRPDRRILYTGALRASGGDTAHQRRKGSLR